MKTSKLVWSLLVLLLAFTAGCGGSDSAPPAAASNDVQESDTEAMDAAAEEMAMPEEPMTAEAEGGAETPISDEEAMQAEMELAMAEGEAAMLAEGGAIPVANRKPPRPQNLSEWTPEHVTDAIMESDGKVFEVIASFAEKNKGKAAAVDQLKTWIAAIGQKPASNAAPSAGGSSSEEGERYLAEENAGGEAMATTEEMYAGSGGGQRAPDFKDKLAETFIRALATVGTRDAFTSIGNVVSGQLSFGGNQGKAMEVAVATLMMNVANPNNPAGGVLMTAMKSVQLDDNNPPPSKDQNPLVGLQQQAKQLHLGFAIAAMNGVIGARGEPGKPGRQPGGFEGGSFGGGEMAAMEAGTAPPPAGPQGGKGPAKPVPVAPISLSQPEALAVLPYLWSKEMVDYAVKQLDQHPDSAEAFVFASAFPTREARVAVQNALTSHQFRPPQDWLHDSVFKNMATDPAIHLLVKQQPRELPPNASGGPSGGEARSPRRNDRDKDEDPEARARKEARFAWMKASEDTFLSLMDRMYQGSLLPDAKPYEPADLMFELHRGAEVTNSLKFELPAVESPVDELKATHKTIVNYVRIESDQMNQRTVQHYRNTLVNKDVVSILGNNGMWLDGAVKPNRRDNTIRSVDILLSKGGARPTFKPATAPQANDGFGSSGETAAYAETGGGGGGGGGRNFVVEVLIVDVPALDAPEEAEAESK